MNFLFVCGGTAGHINPALAIAEEILKNMPDAKILFVGAGKEPEKRLIPYAGFHLVNIRMSGLRRSFSSENLVYNLNTLRNLSTAGVKAENLISRFKPDAVIGTGGYICYPVMRKAAQLGIPTLVHESNAVPGLTTKLLSAVVDKVLISFPGLEELYRRPERVVITGTPVRGGFDAAIESETPPHRARPLVVSFWGSLGAERMNEMMTDFIKLDMENGLFEIIHAAGINGGAGLMKNRLDRQWAASKPGVENREIAASRQGAENREMAASKPGAAAELPPGIEIREYIDDMQAVMSAADLVLCRAGGSTIAELTVMGKPAVLIPSPYVTNNQQMENAKQVQKAGGAILLQEKDCTGEVLYSVVSSLLADREKLISMATAQKELGVPDAAERIVGLTLEQCALNTRD